MENQNVYIRYEQMLNNLENLIKEKKFKTKQDLTNYIYNALNNGFPKEILTEEKIKELLNLYDSLNKEEPTIDIENYIATSLQDNDMIVSKETDTVLKTDTSDINKEFKKVQNELTSANTTSSLANADIVYDEMKDNRKIKLSLLTLDEAIERKDIDREMLEKIKYFINNQQINPHTYRIDINTGTFYDQETNDVLEVRKNETTGEYETYNGGEKVYAEETKNLSQEKKDVKVRRLVKPEEHPTSSAYIKYSLLVIIATITIVTLTVLFMIKYIK